MNVRPFTSLSRKNKQARQQQPQPTGFTLIEMLVSMLLLATLLAGLWSLSHIVSRLFSSGTRVAVEAQLVRSLVAQIRADLHGVQAPPEHTDVQTGLPPKAGSSNAGSSTTSASGSSSLPHFGLVGDEHSLFLAVLEAAAPSSQEQLTAEEAVAGDQLLTGSAPGSSLISTSVMPAGTEDSTSSLESEQDLSGRPEPVRAPELRMVAYTFRSPLEPEEPLPQETTPPPGLTRREVPWEQAPAALTQLNLQPVSQTRPTVTEGFNQFSPVEQQADSGQTDLSLTLDQSLFETPDFGGKDTTVVPEVVDIQFRYFDGQQWQNSWNSLQNGKLPLAVEVTFQLLSDQELKQARKLLGVENTQQLVETDNGMSGTSADGQTTTDTATDSETGGTTGEETSSREQTEPLPVSRTYRTLIFLPAAQPSEQQMRSTAGGAERVF